MEKECTYFNKEALDNEKNFIITDNFSTKSILSTASSDALKEYTPVFNATVVDKLYSNDFSLLAKSKINPFAFPADPFLFTGAKMAEEHNSVCIGSDTFGNSSLIASKYNTLSFKPTYGAISRYGLFQNASSFDTVNITSANIKKIKPTFNIIKGKDDFDMNIVDEINLSKNIKNIILITELFEDIKNNENFESIFAYFKERNINVLKKSIPSSELKKINVIHKIITSVEVMSSFSSFTGLLIDPREEGDNFKDLITAFRSKNLTNEIKKHIVMGSYILSEENREKFYICALKNKRVVVDLFKDLLSDDTLILLPSYNDLSSYKNIYKVANLGGLPYFSIKDKFSLMAEFKNDLSLLDFVEKLLSEAEYEI